MNNVGSLTLISCLALGAVAQAAITDGLLVAHDFNDRVNDSSHGHNTAPDTKVRGLRVCEDDKTF